MSQSGVHSKKPRQWSDRAALLQQIQKWWDRGVLLKIMAAEYAEDGEAESLTSFFPKRLVFKIPDSKALSESFDNVRQWITKINQLKGFRIVDKTIQHRVIGENSLPAEVWVDSLEQALVLISKQSEAAKFSELWLLTREQAPALLPWLMANPLKVLSLKEDWQKLLAFVTWRTAHPNPGIYLRQVCVPGLDSKFIESHRATLKAMLDCVLSPDQIHPNYTAVKQFSERYGFKSKPVRLRFRLLDSELGKGLGLPSGGDRDITLSIKDVASQAELKSFTEQLSNVFITENEINFLAFPEVPNSLVIFGSGYGFEAYANITWLKKVTCYYWGDIDTHGFAILDQLRNYLPEVQSMLMDQQTLQDHQAFWGCEDQPTDRPLARLTESEMETYLALVNNTYGKQLRLEQERISFEYLQRALQKLPI